MKNTIKVRAVWEFEFDSEGYDKTQVDIPGLAKDSAKRELKTLIDSGDISADDFSYYATIPADYNN